MHLRLEACHARKHVHLCRSAPCVDDLPDRRVCDRQLQSATADEMNDDDGGYIRKVTRHLFYLGVLEGFW
jgi:hypothetical protein